MLEVSFYILSPTYESGRDVVACKLAEKAYRQGIFSILYTESENQSRFLDDLLWTFRNTSFVPHQILTVPKPPENPQILICNLFLPGRENLTVINLASAIPNELENCQRILEIIAPDEPAKQAGRQRYRQYQQIGANLVTHPL